MMQQTSLSTIFQQCQCRYTINPTTFVMAVNEVFSNHVSVNLCHAFSQQYKSPHISLLDLLLQVSFIWEIVVPILSISFFFKLIKLYQLHGLSWHLLEL